MKQQKTAIQLFFFSQPFADGVRTTLAVLLPALLGSFVQQFETGITISLGALCASIVDAPGPIIHRKNGMLFCLLFLFFVALITGFARLHLFSMGLELLLFSFVFSLFNVYGLRAAAVGNAALLVLVLTMDQPIEPERIAPYSFFIFCGGLWYMTVSLLAYGMRPYRTAQRVLGESIQAVADFLRIKADFYDLNKDLDSTYRKMVVQQMVVSEKQDTVRELMYKTRMIVKDPSPVGRKLLLTFTDSVDLFEDISAGFYDYATIRSQYQDATILKTISVLAQQMADELEAIGIAVQTNSSYQPQLNFDAALRSLKKQIDQLTPHEGDKGNLVLKKLLVNIRKIMQRIQELHRYFDKPAEATLPDQPVQYSRFVGHQSLDPKIIWNNLNFESTAFRHALRVALASILGFIIAKSIAYGHHSYWIIMTIIFMIKPSISLTKQRNIERIAGTVIGGVAGALLLFFIDHKTILFALMVLFMLGTYSFQRVQYFVSVVCMTPFILILFDFLGLEFLKLIQERILDTVIGCVLALLVSYFLFPDWESKQLHTHLLNMLRANCHYLYQVARSIMGQPPDSTEYKLARKEVYVQSANLSAAFQRMLSEPKSTQKNEQAVHQFVVLNHILSSNIATVAATKWTHPERCYPEAVQRAARKAVHSLYNNLKCFDPAIAVPDLEKLTCTAQGKEQEMQADDVLLKEQLDFMYRVSYDLNKSIKTLTAG